VVEVDDAITSRRSVRAFLPDPVPRATIEHILRIAARAPSGTNIQPWKVWVATGTVRLRLSIALHHARDTEPEAHVQEYKYYPTQWREPYLGRRRKIGWDLYGLLGIARGEKDKMYRQHGRNFDFIDAPVGLIFTIDRDLEIGSWLDFGMFLQNVMVAARGRDLDTCPQAAFAPYHKVFRQELGIPEDQIVICGMSLGREDKAAIENQLTTERMDLADFVRFVED